MRFPLLNSLFLFGNASPIQSCKCFIKSKGFTLSKKKCRKDLISISISAHHRSGTFDCVLQYTSSRRSPFGTRWMDITNLSLSLSQKRVRSSLILKWRMTYSNLVLKNLILEKTLFFPKKKKREKKEGR